MDSVFQEIYDLYHQDIYQFLFYMTKNRELTEDLVQEVYIRVLKSYSQFQGKSSLKTWLISIARNVAIDYFRKEKKKGWKSIIPFYGKKNLELRDQNPMPEEVAIQNDLVKLLYQCMDYCTLDQKTVLIARYIQDLSITETAEVLGWTESKVKTTQHRALKNLKKHMAPFMKKEDVAFEEKKLYFGS